MSVQATQTNLQTFAGFLKAHAVVVRQLNQELVAEHGLTINDYEVLLRLSRADDRMMRRVDLAEQVLLSPSGITRLLEGLERAGYVEKKACPSDARVSYAHLTDVGYQKLRECSKTHVAGIERLFLSHFDADEQESLRELLARVSGGFDSGACAPE
jgi:DNA-binding MarR family transcriptional regulator